MLYDLHKTDIYDIYIDLLSFVHEVNLPVRRLFPSGELCTNV
jgi:hypothetical protein